MEGNFEWFVDHYDEIYDLYGVCYVVIYNKHIVHVFDTEKDAINWTGNHNLLGVANVQYCNGKESGYTTYW